MRKSNPSAWGLAAALVSIAVLVPRTHAFGGLWSSPHGPVALTAARVLFVDNPGATMTAVVQLGYEGPPGSFAWLIPVRGKPQVALSSRTVFDRLDAATAPSYWLEVATAGKCKRSHDTDAGADDNYDYGMDGTPNAADGGAGSVVVIDHGAIGPYAYVDVAADASASDPARAAADWLMSNGFAPTDLDAELLRPYMDAGFGLLAFKLTGDSETSAIRPVMLTYEDEQPQIPLRVAAAGAATDVAIQVWVIGPSQAVPASYASLVLDDALIDWLSARTFDAGTLPAGGAGPFGGHNRRPSNYDALVSAAAAEADGHGFVTELGGPASQYREHVWSAMDEATFTKLKTASYTDGIDAILAANTEYGGWDGVLDAIDGATDLPDGVTIAEFARDPEQYRDGAQVDVRKLFELLDANVLQPVRDAAALLYQAPYLTRLYTKISADALTVDPSFNYNPDLAQVSNVHIARQRITCNTSVARRDAPWRIDLPQGGVVTGKGSAEWPLDVGSLPANLKVVMLSGHGSGTVLQDNSGPIGRALWKAAGETAGEETLRPSDDGVLIGGSQSVTLPGPSASTPAKRTTNDNGCNVSGAGLSLSGLWPSAFVLLMLRRRRAAALCIPLLLLLGCEVSTPAPAMTDDAGNSHLPQALTGEQLRDPASCKGCHPSHYAEWSSSMHAYAAQDPVFVAMNKRGQRETGGELGDFCIKCHAPMAVIDKTSSDGLNLDELPDRKRGVSCFFCHNTDGIVGDHNAKLHLAGDSTLRGPLKDPRDPGAHQARYSDMFEHTNPKSSALCGGCHDIVTQNGIHLERTFEEYRAGIFSKSSTGEPPPFDSCVGCHMPGRTGFAAVAPADAPMRTVHEHLWPGVDVALTKFPNRDALQSAVADCQLGPSVSFFTLEVTPPDLFTFQLETNAGHNQPSGAAQDRRMWLELSAFDDHGNLLESVSSGHIADGEIEERPEDDPKHDPSLLMFRDRIFDEDGKPVHMFWEAAKSDAHPDGYESSVLPVSTTTYIEGKHAVLKQYRVSGPNGLPARVTARLRMRPIGMDVLQDLVDSGDLDPKIAAQMPTFTFGAQIDWTPKDGVMKSISAKLTPADCNTYRCAFEPDTQGCN